MTWKHRVLSYLFVFGMVLLLNGGLAWVGSTVFQEPYLTWLKNTMFYTVSALLVLLWILLFVVVFYLIEVFMS